MASSKFKAYVQADHCEPTHVQVYIAEGKFSSEAQSQQEIDGLFTEIAKLNPKVIIVNGDCPCITGAIEIWISARDKHIASDVIMVYDRSELGMLIQYSKAPQRRQNDIFLDPYVGP